MMLTVLWQIHWITYCIRNEKSNMTAFPIQQPWRECTRSASATSSPPSLTKLFTWTSDLERTTDYCLTWTERQLSHRWNTSTMHSHTACTLHICIWYEPLNKSCRWSRPACLSMRSWKWFQTLRPGIVFERLRTDSGLKIWMSVCTFGLLGRPSSCLWSVLARCLCLRVSSMRRKPVLPPAHRPRSLVCCLLSFKMINWFISLVPLKQAVLTAAYNQ